MQVAENGSVILARFSDTYKCTKIQSYLPVDCVKFLLNLTVSLRFRLSVIQTPISTSLFSLGQTLCCVVASIRLKSFKSLKGGCKIVSHFSLNSCALKEL